MSKSKRYLGIRQIAELAGVSTATVSRVINSPETTTAKIREKVMAVVKKYDYVPNQAAKNLYSGHSNSIALLVYDMANPFYSRFIKHLNIISFENGYTLLVCDAEDSPERELKYLNYCKSIRISGIIYTAGSTRDSIDESGNAPTFPVVVIDRKGFSDKGCFSIRSDHSKGMRLLVEHLHSLNHRKIGFITGPMTILSARVRLDGFLEAMGAFNLPVPEHYIKRGGYSIASGVDACDYFCSLPDRPTAIIASNDLSAQGFILRANANGIRIPDDFSICGYDGVCGDFYPAITSVIQDIDGISKAAFFSIVNHNSCPPPNETVIDVSLDIGSTCKHIII